MNSKPTPQTATAQLVPKLRFPEFENAEGWEERKLIDISYFINEKISLSQISLNNYISTENISPDFFGVVTASKLPNTKTITYFRKEDILISNIRPYLKKVWSATFDGGASNDVIVIRAKENINSQYLSFLLKNEKFIDYIMVGAKGVKMPRGDINLIKKFSLYCPNPKEQQKIADCLSSLDELITAQSQKIEALKQHKKGLMQNLFPVEGQTTPKLRFLEFKNAGEWEEKKLYIPLGVESSQIAKNKLQIKNFGYPIYGADGILGFVDSYAKKDDYIAIVKDGSSVGSLFFYKGKSSLLGTLNYLVSNDNEKYKLKWLYYLLQTINFSPVIKGSGIPHIYYKDYSKIVIPIPSTKEQQKIADCLSSLDELITAQSQKIEALKQHKKGLMQNLFPN